VFTSIDKRFIIMYTEIAIKEGHEMKLSEIVRNYRESHGYSLRQFASLCGLSHAVINNVEKETNSDGNPFTPSFDTLQKIAAGMGISVDSLLREMNDMKIYQSEVDEMRDQLRSRPDLRMLLSASADLDVEDVQMLISIAKKINKEYGVD